MSVFHHILPLGLEINDGFVRAVQLAVARKKLEVIYFKEIKISPTVLHHGLVGEHKVLREAVEAAVRMRSGKWRIGNRAVVVSLPQHQTYYRLFRFDNIDRDDLPQLLEKELTYHVPYAFVDLVFDWQLIQVIENSFFVAVVAVPRVTVESYTSIVLSAGLVPVALEPEIMPLLRVVFPPVQSSDSSLIVFISDTLLIGLVAFGPVIQFVHSRDLGDSSSSVNPFIIETLRYFKDHFSEQKLLNILVSQKVKQLGLDSIFDGVSVRVFDPVQRIFTSTPHEKNQLANDFVISLGLTLRDYASF